MTEQQKITGVRARAVNVPLEFPVRTSVGIVDTAPLVLIDITTETSIVGSSYIFTYTPLALPATRQLVESIGHTLVGELVTPFDVDQTLSKRLRLIGRTGLATMVCAGLDMALWDALAKAHNVPLVTLLGGTPRRIQAYDSHSMDGIELGRQRAARAAQDGFPAIKTKIGHDTLAEDLQVVRALREEIGPDVQILVDYNQSLTVPEATRRIAALADEGVGWVEEPTVQEDLAGYAEIRRRSSVPIQMGENWNEPVDMHRALAAKASDLAMVDAMKIGGVTGWLKAAALAQVGGIPLSSHIFQEFSVHLLAVTPTAHYLEKMDLAGPILASPLAFADGHAICPEEPGAGISWNEAAIARFAV
jgi:mandelate racemase